MPIDSALRLSIHGRLRHYPADSPSTSDRIEFTSTPPTGSLCYGLVVLVALLSTSCCHDAVTSRYPTASAAGERTSTAPSCCLLRRTGEGRAATRGAAPSGAKARPKRRIQRPPPADGGRGCRSATTSTRNSEMRGVPGQKRIPGSHRTPVRLVSARFNPTPRPCEHERTRKHAPNRRDSCHDSALLPPS